jgi:hypothetical protein
MRHLMAKGTTVLTAVFVLGAVVPSAATPITNSTGISSPAATIVFSEFGLTANTVITTQYASLGATFSPNLYQNPQSTLFPHVDPGPGSLSNFSIAGDPTVSPFSIFFNVTQTSAAFAMVSNPTSTLFEALLGNVVVDAFSAPTDSASTNNFHGFTGVSFNQIRVTASAPAVILDNLQLSQVNQVNAGVPEPGSLTLLATGLAGLVGLVRRNRAKRA